MAIVFLPLNGIGLGHLARSFILARELRARGESPIVLAQGHYPEFMAREMPGCSIGPIRKASHAERRRFAAEIETCARRTRSAVVIEDTHPAPLELGADVRRLLLVRPTTMQQMRNLQAKYALNYETILVTDHWESPTWPFTAAETAQIRSWSSWRCIGPIFREGSPAGRARIREKYSLGDGERVYVFGMGGGGVHPNGSGDIARFFAEAERIGRLLRQTSGDCRLLFVRGPLFPADQSIPELFEDYRTEDDLPSLYSVAAGAVVRAGFNTTWECFAAGTPLIAIEGYTYAEPVADRLKRLTAAELLPECVEQWLDPGWTADFKQAAAETVARWPLAKAIDTLQAVIDPEAAVDERRTAPAPMVLPFSKREAKSDLLIPRASPLAAPHWPLTTQKGRVPFYSADSVKGDSPRPALLIRIDDVIELSAELRRTIDLCAARGLCVSLEVVPYFCRFDERELVEFLGGAVRFEVSQHGFSHLPRRLADGRKSDFHSDQDFETDLETGRTILQRLFPTTFRGGFSAPYDTFPPGLAPSWQRRGGRYLSALWAQFDDCRLPVVYYAVDPWDWRRGRERSHSRCIRKLRESLTHHGHAGLALHPQLLTSAARVANLERLLDEVLTLGCQPALASEVASHRQQIAASPSHSWAP